MNNIKHFILFFLLLAGLCACKTRLTVAAKAVTDSTSASIKFQQKRNYTFNNGTLLFSNNFASARLNHISQLNDSSFVIDIEPENTPVNPSPWYAFKVWSDKDRNLNIELNYQGATHRYQPKLKLENQPWTDITEVQLSKDKKKGYFRVHVSKDTALIAAQELMSSEDNYLWEDSLSKFAGVKKKKIGKSLLGKDIDVLEIGQNNKNLIVVLSRQHPPEVTGYMAMQEFIKTITAKTELAKTFRKHYQVLLFPLLNPDGVDEGNWRHSAAGVDLNRDWENFNQPETQAVRNYLLKAVEGGKSKVFFGIDFHSTYYDVFYTNQDQPANKTNLPGFTNKWLKAFGSGIPDFKPNIKPSPNGGNVSKSWMGRVLHAEALTYEVGDDTPRELLKLKGKVAAEKMMELLLQTMKSQLK